MSGSANVAAWSGTIGFAILFAGAAVAAAISYGLIFLLMPLLRRHAQASPNARHLTKFLLHKEVEQPSSQPSL